LSFFGGVLRGERGVYFTPLSNYRLFAKAAQSNRRGLDPSQKQLVRTTRRMWNPFAKTAQSDRIKLQNCKIKNLGDKLRNSD
jgi:hypothetical protein